MEIQTTPASPPQKVRRIGSASSIKEVREVPEKDLEKADSNDDLISSNGNKKIIQPSKSTKEIFTGTKASTSSKSSQEAQTQFWHNVVDTETNKNYNIHEYISSQDKHDKLSVPEDKNDELSFPEDKTNGKCVPEYKGDEIPVPEEEDRVSICDDEVDGVSTRNDEDDGVSVSEDQTGGKSVSEEKTDGKSVSVDKTDKKNVPEDEAQNKIGSEVNEAETTQNRLKVDSPKDDLDIILESMGCNDTKSKDKLLEEYFNNPACRQLTKSFFRSALQTYLISNGELVYNSNSSTELLNTINEADFLTIIKIFAGLLKQNDVQSNPSTQGVNHLILTNHSGDIVAQGVPPNKFYSTQGTQTDEPTQMDDGVRAGTFIDEIYELHLNKVTGSLFTDMRAEMHETDEKRNIIAIGKILLKTFFTEQEILEGFLRKQCKKDGKETQAYDVKRVFIISQIINFMITENEAITATNFKATTNKNKGLQGKQYEDFIKGVMVDYANCLRKNIKLAKQTASSSSAVL